MEKINQAMSDALETHRSIRILGDLPTERLNPEDYLASTQELTKSLIDSWKEKADLRLLAVEIWPQHTYFALDFNDDEYNYDNAHTQVVVIPVYLLRLSRKSHNWTIFRHKPQDSSLAKRIARLHEGNGQDPTPFLEDHIKGVIRYAPRSSKSSVVASESPICDDTGHVSAAHSGGLQVSSPGERSGPCSNNAANTNADQCQMNAAHQLHWRRKDVEHRSTVLTEQENMPVLLPKSDGESPITQLSRDMGGFDLQLWNRDHLSIMTIIERWLVTAYCGFPVDWCLPIRERLAKLGEAVHHACSLFRSRGHNAKHKR